MLYISPSLVAQMQAEQSFNKARIGYRTITSSAAITASSEAPATLIIDAGSLVAANYVGVAAHTLGSAGATVYEWNHLTARWYRDYFDPFVESALKQPFFIAWKPDRFPDEVLYAWCNHIR